MTTPQGDLPTGTVTFLFTDIEGSTRLANQLGPMFGAQLGEHDRILREAISANHGTVYSTAGDSFFATLPDAASVVIAAVAAQRGLHVFAWADDPIRARMGLHTADRTADDDGYPEIARAARIMAAAHGGQVLLSDATHTLMADRLPEGVRVRTLGAYRLKDIPQPDRLHQLEIARLPSSFPPLHALDVRRSHLPPDATTFIGRADQLARIGDLVFEHTGSSRSPDLADPGRRGWQFARPPRSRIEWPTEAPSSRSQRPRMARSFLRSSHRHSGCPRTAIARSPRSCATGCVSARSCWSWTVSSRSWARRWLLRD